MLKISKEIEELFLENIKTLLVEGKKRKVTKKRKTVKNIYDVSSDGNYDFVLTGREITRTEDEIEYFDGVPDKILDLVYQSLSTENSIKHLENLGYVVVDPTLVNSEDDTNQGLSENTINLIKSKILGIN